LPREKSRRTEQHDVLLGVEEVALAEAARLLGGEEITQLSAITGDAGRRLTIEAPLPSPFPVGPDDPTSSTGCGLARRRLGTSTRSRWERRAAALRPVGVAGLRCGVAAGALPVSARAADFLTDRDGNKISFANLDGSVGGTWPLPGHRQPSRRLPSLLRSPAAPPWRSSLPLSPN